MRGLLACMVALCLLYGSAYAVDGGRNLQKIHAVDSEVYEAITYLYIGQGYALPSTTGPWSSDELLKMLGKIDRARLAPGSAAAYDFAMAALDEGRSNFKFGLEVAAEGYFHTDTTNFTREKDWIRGYADRKPALDLSLETWLTDHFYGFSSLSVGNARYNGFDATGPTSSQFGSTAFASNLPLVPPSVLMDLDFNIPYRAFGSVGGEGWSAQFGRDRMSWGPGVSGNFVSGDNLLCRYLLQLTMAQNFGERMRELPQGCQRLLGAVFLEEAEDGIEQHDGSDGNGVDPFAQQPGH